MRDNVREWFLEGSDDDIDSKLNSIHSHLDQVNKIVLRGQNLLKEITEGHTQCESCGKFSPNESFRCDYEVRREVEITYTDAWYGDNDEEGLVENLYVYSVCPRCGHKKVVKKILASVIETWSAREGRRRSHSFF